MNFRREVKEESFDYCGRCVLILTLSISLPCTDGEGERSPSFEHANECLRELFECALGEAKDRYFARCCSKYDDALSSGERFYPYRVSVDISPVGQLKEHTCPFAKAKKQKKKKRLYCSEEGCIMFEVTCRLARRGKVMAKEQKSFALRLSDGWVCCPTRDNKQL